MGCTDCAKRLYKLNERNNKYCQAELKTEISRKTLLSAEGCIKTIQAKEYLYTKIQSNLLTYSALNSPQMDVGWKGDFRRIGRKHLFRRQDLI